METESRVKILRSRLGVDERLNLLRLRKDNYLRLRMNAQSLRARIVQRLRERKFELEHLHQSFRNVLNGEPYLAFDYRFSLLCLQIRNWQTTFDLQLNGATLPFRSSRKHTTRS